MKAFLLTAFALTAFAFNSILCRLALGADSIDASSFTSVRLLSGAATLLGISFFIKKTPVKVSSRGNWTSAIFLFGYAICFSFAYVGLTTATGALILFGMVQATMLIWAIAKGERPSLLQWAGLLIAVFGLIYLVFPGLRAPPLWSSLLMAFAGICWGFYTLRGKGSKNPLGDTTGNFLRTIPFTVLAGAPFYGNINLSPAGFAFAVLSGSIASGIGYSVWYAALKYHTAARAAILQLAVPALAAIGGLVFLAEMISIRIFVASALILGGIALSIIAKDRYRESAEPQQNDTTRL